jgi:5-methylcytosine-specific restriction endonuclease McrA
MKKTIINKWSVFWRWTVLWEWIPKVEPSWRKRITLKVKCECWNIKNITKSILVSGKSLSCWCLQKEIASKIWKKTWPINAIKYAHWWNKGLYWINNPSYKWRTRLSINIRNSDEYKEWRTKCFERDNYTCQISWQKWWDIVVHHLEPFNLIISDLDIETYRNCELLWDINNWITITKELHNKFHKEYWKKYFTKEDFLEFKNNYKNEKQ